MANPKEQFIADLYPAARRIGQETGMSWELILAQAALETGWGEKVLPGTNNIFNIKADSRWEGESKTFRVPEYINGKWVQQDASFRVYESVEDALRDRVEFLRDNPRYARAGLFEEGTKGDLRKEAQALQRAGYATDPAYADQLVDVFNGRTMRRGIEQGRTQAPEQAESQPRQADQGATHGHWPAPGNYSINRADKPGEGAGGWNTARPAHRDGDGHDGVDIQGKVGDPIKAFKGGTVVSAGFVRGYGNTIDIRHDDGSTTRYAHLDSISPDVKGGRTVDGGQQIGRMGKTGNAPDAGDAHLHFEYRVNGRDVDPMPLLNRAQRDGQAQTGPGGATRDGQATGALADGVLKPGDRGPEVQAYLEKLDRLGYRGPRGESLLADKPDIYGPAAKHATETFQRAHNLTPDGKAGKDTLPMVDRALQNPLLSEANHPGNGYYRNVAAQIEKLRPGTDPLVAMKVAKEGIQEGFKDPQVGYSAQRDLFAIAPKPGIDVTPGLQTRIEGSKPAESAQALSDQAVKDFKAMQADKAAPANDVGTQSRIEPDDQERRKPLVLG